LVRLPRAVPLAVLSALGHSATWDSRILDLHGPLRSKSGHRKLSGKARASFSFQTLFNLAIDSKLRGCDVVGLKIADVAPNGAAMVCTLQRDLDPLDLEIVERALQGVWEGIAAGLAPLDL
jgi:hypothetical protein